jgi:hypothetical protein
MKSSYELALERLNKTSPTVKLSAAQKKQLAELDSKYTAKIAEREISMKGEMAQATAAGDLDKVEMLQQQLTSDRKKIQSDLEDKKEAVRQAATK